MKKKSKRWLAVVLTIAMLFTMSVTAFAEEPEDSFNQNLTIDQAESDVQNEEDTSIEKSDVQDLEKAEESAAEADDTEKPKKAAAAAKAVVADGTRTVLYEDGTLILNESDNSQAENAAKHGAVTKEYPAWKNADSYHFNSNADAPWYSEADQIKSVEIGSVISPTTTAHWFSNLHFVSNMSLEKLDTRNTTDASYMFSGLGDQAESVTISGLETWDMSNVVTIDHIFYDLGASAKGKVSIQGLGSWDMSNVENMAFSFFRCGMSASQVETPGLENWNVSNVKTTNRMFGLYAASAATVSLALPDWDMGNVTDTAYMFARFAEKVTVYDLSWIENWDMSNVTTIAGMFSAALESVEELVVDFSKWDVSKVTSTSYTFHHFGRNGKRVIIKGLDKWNTISVAEMTSMFSIEQDTSVQEYQIGTLTIPAGCNVSSMFSKAQNITGTLKIMGSLVYDAEWGDFAGEANTTGGALYLAPTNKDGLTWARETVGKYGLSGSVSEGHIYLNEDNIVGRTVLYEDGTLILNELAKNQSANEAKHGAVRKEFPAWDGVENDYVFGNTGVPWFNYRYDITAVEVGSKISPVDTSKWFFECSYATTAELSKLDMSNVTSADQMFYNFGGMASGKDVVISGLETWDVGKLQNLHGMFMWVGQFASSVTITGFTNWDTRNAEDTSQMFEFAGRSAKVVNLSSFDGWNTIKIKTTAKMFYGLGYEAVSVNLSGFENWVTVSLENTESMFAECASSDKQEVVMDLSKWVIFNVTNMRNMFASFRVSAEKVTFLGLDHWKFNNNAILSGMFDMLGISASTPSVSEYNIGTLTIPGGCIVDNMFQGAHNVKGILKLDGMPVSEYGGDINLAWRANTAGGALYLAPTNKEALTFAEETVSKYGPSGSESEGNIYLLRDYLMRTVLYEDGTLIINESGKDQEANEAKHGAASKEYPAWDGKENDYDFSNGSALWYDDNSNIKSIEIGSKISPVNTTKWFNRCSVSSIDVSLLDMSNVTNTSKMFAEGSIDEIIGLESWNVSKVKDASCMFGWLTMYSKGLKGIENWHFAKGTNLSEMFCCSVLQFDSFTIPEGCNVTNMFANAKSITGNLIINGAQNCAEDNGEGFARYTNCGSGALYLVPDDAAYSWAEEMERKYGPNGSFSQGNVYLQKLFDFMVTESIDMTGSANTADLTVTDLTVENLGRKEITVSSVQIGSTLNGWSAVAATTDFKNLAKDSKQFALLLSGTDLFAGPYTAGGTIAVDGQKVFKLTGKTGVVSKAINRQQIANLVVTVMAAE